MKPTNYPNGVTTADPASPLGDFVLPDPTKSHVYMEDFDYYVASDWTVTEVGAATQVLLAAAGDGGRLFIENTPNGPAENDFSLNQKVGSSFTFTLGKKLWFDALFQISDATQSELAFGLQPTNSTGFPSDNSIFFFKDDGVSSISFITQKSGSSSTAVAIIPVTDATDIRLSFFFDGINTLKLFANGTVVRTPGNTSLGTTVPLDVPLRVTFVIKNGEDASKTMTVDYIMVAKER